MSDNYYGTLGNILKDALTSDEDPFDTLHKQSGKYRTIGGRMERKPPPLINTETKRVPVPPELVEDFAVLNVLPGVPLEDCKKAWKHLIKKHHPDLAAHGNTQIDPNDVIRRINNSYKKIEAWFKTGVILTAEQLNS